MGAGGSGNNCLLYVVAEGTKSKAEPADAQNPAMTTQFQIASQWRGVCDPQRSAFWRTQTLI